MNVASTGDVRPKDRTAAQLLAALALLPLGIAAVALWYELPDLGGATETAGHTKEAFFFLTLPTPADGLLALIAAWSLWTVSPSGDRWQSSG